ncbi:MAG: hypothetical protein ACYTGQ_06205, partial [Planctomycetota bacterium]
MKQKYMRSWAQVFCVVFLSLLCTNRLVGQDTYLWSAPVDFTLHDWHDPSNWVLSPADLVSDLPTLGAPAATEGGDIGFG